MISVLDNFVTNNEMLNFSDSMFCFWGLFKIEAMHGQIYEKTAWPGYNMRTLIMFVSHKNMLHLRFTSRIIWSDHVSVPRWWWYKTWV